MPAKKQHPIETLFEAALWKSRGIIILAVVFSIISSFALFVAGSCKIGLSVVKTFAHPEQIDNYNYLLINIIGAVDLYLIGMVLMIFGFGIYELFISKLDIAHEDSELNILEVQSLDDLKNRLLKVIVMAMVVHFFKVILEIHPTNSLEMLFLGGAIILIAGSTYFIRKH
ncbi:MAG: YqhA family protein [Candidatus Omnitrophica bacterium]|nr:YqhA family protein [Candidatus Omnitrophota bacterium]